MTGSVLKSHFPNKNANIVSYCNYKRFRNDSFGNELYNGLLNYDLHNIEYQNVLNIFSDILNKHAPMKKKENRRKSK